MVTVPVPSTTNTSAAKECPIPPTRRRRRRAGAQCTAVRNEGVVKIIPMVFRAIPSLSMSLEITIYTDP
jgi:hypothetical protein